MNLDVRVDTRRYLLAYRIILSAVKTTALTSLVCIVLCNNFSEQQATFDNSP